MASRNILDPDFDYATVPAFDGYPYLVTRLVPAFHHIMLLPVRWGLERRAEFALQQVRANRLPTCLVEDRDDCFYLSPETLEVDRADQIPRADCWIADRLKPAQRIPALQEIEVRRSALALFLDTLPGNDGVLMGPATKEGREASVEELWSLAGYGPEGVPVGLERCDRCGEWLGECLEQDPCLRGLVQTVYCRCANDNRCARCTQLLYDRRLAANYYDQTDDRIWHVPGFVGLAHGCDRALILPVHDVTATA